MRLIDTNANHIGPGRNGLGILQVQVLENISQRVSGSKLNERTQFIVK